MGPRPWPSTWPSGGGWPAEAARLRTPGHDSPLDFILWRRLGTLAMFLMPACADLACLQAGYALRRQARLDPHGECGPLILHIAPRRTPLDAAEDAGRSVLRRASDSKSVHTSNAARTGPGGAPCATFQVRRSRLTPRCFSRSRLAPRLSVPCGPGAGSSRRPDRGPTGTAWSCAGRGNGPDFLLL